MPSIPLQKSPLNQQAFFARLSSSLVLSVEALETASAHNAETPSAENAEQIEKAVYWVRGDCPLPFFCSAETEQKKKCSDRCGGKREEYLHGGVSDSGLWIISAPHGEGHCW